MGLSSYTLSPCERLKMLSVQCAFDIIKLLNATLVLNIEAINYLVHIILIIIENATILWVQLCCNNGTVPLLLSAFGSC